MALVCVSITATSTGAAQAEIDIAESNEAEMVELRLDFLAEGENWESLVSYGKLPKIVTNRASWEGGNSDESEEVRLGKLIRALDIGADFIDVELKAAETYEQLIQGTPKKGLKILSYHDFEKTPSLEELSQIYAKMLEKGADLCKIAVTANDISDCARVLHVLQAATNPTIMLAMTERGMLTRLLAGKYGSMLTFCSTNSGKESAPGQIAVAELRSLYRFKSIENLTKVYGIIGNPVSHSMSPAIHNAAFKHRKVDAVYIPLLVDDVEKFLKSFDEFKFNGFSITIPHKEAALKCVDVVDEVAERIGAINTIVRLKDGRTKGYNTDWMAAIGAVERALLSLDPEYRRRQEAPLRIREDEGVERPLNGKHVVLVGAGGAARGMAFGAVERGAKALTIVNRTMERAEKLVGEMKSMGKPCECTAMSIAAFQAGEAGEFDVVMNSTSIGMHPNEGDTPVDSDLLSESMVVFDAVYNPRETRLLREAKDKGCVVVDGVEMFVGQALKQYELWTETKPPKSVMEDAVLRGLKLK
ncbi:hypothetical protein NDN08_005814 [Rhodosorus marinus]|uniref:Shikimate dehydrogenase (NADP(+)) n=1 Tax=Rhodosorus marinus TaxID=101924 RepID=A0AAV8V332_9RHOD|nr:hypothetical protein NDN08_005814 [Rhodosorus marinus]